LRYQAAIHRAGTPVEIFLEKTFSGRNHSRAMAFGVMAEKIGVRA
jgi:hypothetical protein